MVQGESVLIFDGNCGMCRKLSSQIAAYSHEQISVIPLRSNEAETLLKQFFPKGRPHNYFLIEKRDGNSKMWQGRRAALRLGRRLPIAGSARVLVTYLQFRTTRSRVIGRSGKIGLQSLDNHPPKERREFLRGAFAGTAALMLGWVLTGIPVAHGSVAKEHALPQKIWLDSSFLIDGRMPKHLVISPQGQVIEAYNEDRPVPSSPDCACFPCACCGQQPNCCACVCSAEGDLCYYVCNDCFGNLYLDGTTGDGCGLGCCDGITSCYPS